VTTCYNCGGEIIFRYVGGQLTPIHLSGSCFGDSSYSGETIREGWRPLPAPVERASKSWQLGHARSDSGVPFTHPTICPICGAFIFFHTNGNGDVVFFDELGPPWPKHPCLSSDEGRRAGSHSPDLMRLVGLYAPPKIIHRPMPTSPIPEESSDGPDQSQDPAPSLLGVVMRVSERISWRGRADTFVRSRVRLIFVDLCLSGNRSAAINIPDNLDVSVGQVVRLRPVEGELDGRRALYADSLDPVQFTGSFEDIDTGKAGSRIAPGSSEISNNASRTGPLTPPPTDQPGTVPHPIVKALAALTTACPLGEVVAVVRTHVLQVTAAPIDRELFPPLRDAVRTAMDSGNLDLAAGWLFALELVPLTRKNAIEWRAKARRLLSKDSSPQF